MSGTREDPLPLVILDKTTPFVFACNFIFSNGILFRLSRHLAFWAVLSGWFYIDNKLYHLPNLPVSILTTYTTLYFLIPRYLLRNKYRAFIVTMLFLGILYPVIFILNPITYFSDTDKFISDHAFVFDGVFDRQDLILWKVGQWDAWGLTMCLSGFAAVIKLMKLYYLENTENKQLQERKINYELQTLKSQLNARFLFNALQSIKQHARSQSPNSSGLILKLSDLLSYILYENEEKSVPLSKEIEMIEGYLEFENEGRGNSIDLVVTKQGEIDDKRIVPLVLLPLVESCFDRSLTEAQKGASILLDFDVKKLVLELNIRINSLHDPLLGGFQETIRFKNAQQRLNFYYTGRYQLEITEANKNHVVRLEIAL